MKHSSSLKVCKSLFSWQIVNMFLFVLPRVFFRGLVLCSPVRLRSLSHSWTSESLPYRVYASACPSSCPAEDSDQSLLYRVYAPICPSVGNCLWLHYYTSWFAELQLIRLYYFISSYRATFLVHEDLLVLVQGYSTEPPREIRICLVLDSQ